MSMSTSVAIPTTLTDLLQARADALRLIGDSISIMQKACEVLAPMGSHLMPYSARINGDVGQIRRELDASMWRRALDLTGFKQLMDAEAANEFEKGLEPNPPEFSEGTNQQRLGTGLRINSAADDAAGLQIATPGCLTQLL